MDKNSDFLLIAKFFASPINFYSPFSNFMTSRQSSWSKFQHIFTHISSFFTGIPSGSADQECPLSRPVFVLPHQVILHLEYPYYSSIRTRIQPLRHLADVVG